MPYQPLPSPPPPQGPTASVPLNAVVGLGTVFGTNTFTAAQSGPDAVGLGYLVAILFQFVKQPKWFDQHRWWPLVLVVIALPLALIVSQSDWVQALPKTGHVAWQAMADFVGMKGTGLGGMSSATEYPD